MCPTCNGPVGLAETYSTFTLRPSPISERPKLVPAASATGITEVQNSGDKRKFKNPGPATSADTTLSSSINNSAKVSAITLGLTPAGFAKTIAALVDISPCKESLGGSTVTFEKFKLSGKVPESFNISKEDKTRLRMSENKFISLSNICI